MRSRFNYHFSSSPISSPPLALPVPTPPPPPPSSCSFPFLPQLHLFSLRELRISVSFQTTASRSFEKKLNLAPKDGGKTVVQFIRNPSRIELCKIGGFRISSVLYIGH